MWTFIYFAGGLVSYLALRLLFRRWYSDSNAHRKLWSCYLLAIPEGWVILLAWPFAAVVSAWVLVADIWDVRIKRAAARRNAELVERRSKYDDLTLNQKVDLLSQEVKASENRSNTQ